MHYRKKDGILINVAAASEADDEKEIKKVVDKMKLTWYDIKVAENDNETDCSLKTKQNETLSKS